jgi:Ca2+-binding EF-hand superfamily protein
MMTSNRSLKLAAIAGLLAGSLLTAGPILGADENNPLDPAYQTPQQMAYWKDKVAKMDMKSDGKVTKEGFLKYYSDLWDKHAPPGKSAVTINELAAKWASMEEQNPLDPEYKSALWRREHVASIDTDHDGTVTKEEFLKHMETHWAEETQRFQATALTHEQAMQMMTRNPLDPSYKPH